jgi:hypothetical protein
LKERNNPKYDHEPYFIIDKEIPKIVNRQGGTTVA